jgi:hypothetical protein
VSLTATNHAENQEVHLRLPPGAEARRVHIQRNVGEFAGLLGRACPAQVYEYVDAEEGVGSDSKVEDVTASGKKFVINSQVRSFAIGCFASTFLIIICTDVYYLQLVSISLAAARSRLELYPLQTMRYQGANARHHLDGPRGWGRTEILCVLTFG